MRDVTTALNDHQAAMVDQLRETFSWTSKIEISPDSDLGGANFAELFLDRLRLHWFITGRPMSKHAFEYALADTLSSQNEHKALLVDNSINPGADIVWGSQRISLKTEAAKSTHRTRVHISKFSEARWIMSAIDPETALAATKANFANHYDDFDRLMTLRCWVRPTDSQIDYQLVEIPKSLLMRIQHSTVDEFGFNAKGLPSRLSVISEHGDRLFGVTLDRSVEKLTISGLGIENCLVHMQWTHSYPEARVSSSKP